MSPRKRLMTALRGGMPDRVPCFPSIIRWIRTHYGCTCPRHQIKLAEEFGLDVIVHYGQYVWQSVSNDYMYAPGGGYSYSAFGLYGDLPDVNVEVQIKNERDHVWYDRTFHTPAGDLHDMIQWARPNVGYGDGPNPHRVERQSGNFRRAFELPISIDADAVEATSKNGVLILRMPKAAEHRPRQIPVNAN